MISVNMKAILWIWYFWQFSLAFSRGQVYVSSSIFYLIFVKIELASIVVYEKN